MEAALAGDCITARDAMAAVVGFLSDVVGCGGVVVAVA